MKKLLSLTLSLVVCLSLCACGSSDTAQTQPEADTSVVEEVQEVTPASIIKNAQLQYPASNELFKYNVYDTYVEITEYIGADDAEEVVVPAMLEDLPVYEIDHDVFSKSGVKSIVFEDGIYNIHTEFSADLVSVVLPSTLDYIGSSTFENCYSLENVVIPEGITGIQMDAFKHCGLLKTVTIPSTVSYLGNEAFAYCDGLETVTLCEGLFSIDDGVFLGCESLKSITIPNSVETIGNHAFQGAGLEMIEIPETVKKIESGLFTGCEALTVVKVHNAELEIVPEEGFSIAMLFSQCNPDLVVHGKAGSTIAKQCAQEDTFFEVMK